MSGAVIVSITGLLLLRVRTSVETPPRVILAGLKDLPKVGATKLGLVSEVTVKVAITGDTLLPVLVFSAPEGRELM